MHKHLRFYIKRCDNYKQLETSPKDSATTKNQHLEIALTSKNQHQVLY
ncbi:hypothetical protein ACVQ9Z_11955 [Staphylococcus aureus]